jgi:bacillithiol biosynthesis cysteine-adding enzyme BshC
MSGGRLAALVEQGVTAPTVVRTLSLGGGPLTAAALDGSAPGHWYPPRPGDPRAWDARIEQVRRQPPATDWLSALWPAIAAEGPAAERLRNAAAHGVVVTTGQQPGLFGGPMYTWSKAIGVLALADAIEKSTGVPVAPVFWAATDDTDFAEASTTWVAARGGAVALTAVPAAEPGTVLAGARLGDLSAAFDGLAAAAGSAPYTEALDAVRTAYAVQESRRSPVTAGHAYVALLRRLLAPLGVAVIDASHAAVRTSAMPVLVGALERADVVARALAERTREISAHGYTPQVSDVAALSLVFEWSGLAGEPADGADGAASDGEPPAGARKTRIPLKRAADAAARAPAGTLSGNVLLRPVVERSILPTIAYLGGPGEIAYFAQTSAVAAALGLPAPLAVPRWSCSLLEPAIAALMERHGISEQALRDAHGPEGRLARAALPAAIRDALAALRSAVDIGVDDVAAADPAGLVSGAAIEGARVHLRHRVGRLERRYLAAAKYAAAAMMADVATVRGALRPNGTPQERALNFIPFLARGGPALVEAMRVQAARHASALVGGGSSAIR